MRETVERHRDLARRERQGQGERETQRSCERRETEMDGDKYRDEEGEIDGYSLRESWTEIDKTRAMRRE